MTEHVLTAAITGSLPLHTFAVEAEVTVAANRRRAFIAFTQEIDHWWHYRIRDGARSVIEPQAGGRWLQAWENGELLFGTFTLWDPPNGIRLAGPLAMDGLAYNVVDVLFDEVGDQTAVRVVHRGVGDFDATTEELYRTGWVDLLEGAYRPHVARGRRSRPFGGRRAGEPVRR